MLKNKRFYSLAIVSMLLLPGCAAVVATGAATGVAVLHDRRTAGTVLEDRSIEFKAHRALHSMLKDNPEARVSFVSYNNVILLVGQVPDESFKNAVEAEVRTIDKVQRVHNELQIGEKTSLKRQSSDTVITTKIKSELLVNKNIDPTRIKVITEDSNVYLMGIIQKDEEEAAVDTARHVKGVKKVVKIFEYSPDFK